MGRHLANNMYKVHSAPGHGWRLSHARARTSKRTHARTSANAEARAQVRTHARTHTRRPKAGGQRQSLRQNAQDTAVAFARRERYPAYQATLRVLYSNPHERSGGWAATTSTGLTPMADGMGWNFS